MSGPEPDLVLASASPRRLELLSRLGLVPEVQAADINECWHPSEPADDYVVRMATEKALTVAGEGRRKGDPALTRNALAILGADTAVILDGEPLGKPADNEYAREMLTALSGRSHRVRTAVCVVGMKGEQSIQFAEAKVRFVEISEAEIEWYIQSGEPSGCAGAYAIQGAGAAFVEEIAGDPTTVIGLPLRLAANMLNSVGVRTNLGKGAD